MTLAHDGPEPWVPDADGQSRRADDCGESAADASMGLLVTPTTTDAHTDTDNRASAKSDGLPGAPLRPGAQPAPLDAGCRRPGRRAEPPRARRPARDLEGPRALRDEAAALQVGLLQLVSWRVAEAPARETLTPFHCKEPPGISLSDYLARTVRFTRCSPACLVAALVYLDRLIRHRRVVAVSALSCHRLVLLCIVSAIKFHEEKSDGNAHYAKVGGVRLQELNSMEAKFLRMVEWKLLVQPHEYQLYHRRLLDAQAAALSQ